MQDLARDGKPTPRLKARVRREELEGVLLRLEELARELGTTTADEDAQARAHLVNVAIEHLQESMNALMLASGEHAYRH